MPNSKPDDAQIVSVRLPRDLIQRLDRYLDWLESPPPSEILT